MRGSVRHAVLFGALLSSAGVASAQTPEAFYKNRTVEMIVGTSPGGGYDLYGRLIARYIGRYIPGNPTVIVRNMPGAGSISMTNWLYNVAPRDGTDAAQRCEISFRHRYGNAEGGVTLHSGR